MNKPHASDILKPLKRFQRRTVDHAFRRLFLDADSTSRFLVADEVGLGKTLVARGIIARVIDHLWDDVNRIDVIYICSNAGIARANLPKLQIGGARERSFALATRLTMLATEFASRDGGCGFTENKLNFISFTPGTSFNMGHSGGWRREREVLFHLLRPHVGRITPLKNLLQGRVASKERWRQGLHAELPIDPGIRRGFDEKYEHHSDLQLKLREALDTWFHRYRPRWPDEARWARNDLIGDLRRLLAEICIPALKPDLVILDEFQRFKPLIETREDRRSEAAELAQSLFQAKAHDGRPVPTLLLSATPYKLFTTDAEIEQEDHYEDFLATTRFLFSGREVDVCNLTQSLARFGNTLRRAAPDDGGTLQDAAKAKTDVEGILRAVMARTERVAASEEHDAMLNEPGANISLKSADVRQYLAADALFQAVGDRDPMPFWKSAPYLVHFMRGYRFNERLDEALELSPSKVASLLQAHEQAFLSAEALREWSEIDPAHPKMRDMVTDQLDRGIWRLLWVPPTLPYWPLEGPFRDRAGLTKTLMFSAWNVVPDVVSAVISYEAERRMTERRIGSYLGPAEQQGSLLRFTQSAARKRSRHRLLLLLLPCLPLADRVHPLEAPSGLDRRKWVRKAIEALLSASGLPDPKDGPIDDRWEWATPLLLDPDMRGFVEAWRDGRIRAVEGDGPLQRPNPELFGTYVKDLLDLPPEELGRRPPGLVDLLTEVALGSPAILALRSLGSPSPPGIGCLVRRRLAVSIAAAFWSLFNQPAVISLLRHLFAGKKGSRDDTAYWRLVLEYCRQGNLQAVLDEHWHLLWEQHAWSETADATSIATECVKTLVKVVRPIRSRVHGRFLQAREPDRVECEQLCIRTVFALRFGHLRTENEENISEDMVRAAFNSPFRPFLLASTSIGQEGLDFHPWCHRLVHWNLPGNPVDLEQREGRVHRYKGHAVRRNVATAHAGAALNSWKPGKDLWALIFEHADRASREADDSDLVPHWIASGDCQVERHVPLLPYAREVEAFRRLKRQLAAYRVVFGQPRQEELITLLDQADFSNSQLRKLMIDLSPPDNKFPRPVDVQSEA